ncbi:MAG: FeoB-associated Cys-rich membrane protein [Mogibacterium sp.]|nr:FeoB-associated Cys-rich membrane protein [Mogibacterium sp.]
MNAATIIAIIVIAAILFFAIRYIYKEKKKGNACIGCPYADSCPRHRQEGASCCGSTVQHKADLN